MTRLTRRATPAGLVGAPHAGTLRGCDSKSGEGGVGRVGDPDPGKACVLEGVERRGGDPLARREDRDAGWVGRDELGADAADDAVERDRFGGGEECVPGRYVGDRVEA